MMRVLRFLKRNFGIILILVTAIFYMSYLNSKDSYGDNTPEFEAGRKILEFTTNQTPDIVSVGNNFFYNVKPREIQYIKYDGEVAWSDVNLYDNPSISYRGEYISIIETGGSKSASVYDTKGHLYTVSLNSPILNVSVNKNGFIAVVSKDVASNSYVISVYNKSGVMMMSRHVTDENRYPVSVDVSEDNSILAVSTISTDSLQLKSSISLSNIFDNNNNSDNGVIAGINLDDGVIAGKVVFFNNNLVICTDKNIIQYGLSEYTLLEPVYYNFDNYIDFAKIINEDYFAIILGAEINNSIYTAGTILFYNFKGDLVGTYVSDNGITSVSVAEKSLIITSGKKCYNISIQGRELWQYSHNRELNEALYVGDKTIGLLIENDGISTLVKRR